MLCIRHVGLRAKGSQGYFLWIDAGPWPCFRWRQIPRGWVECIMLELCMLVEYYPKWNLSPSFYLSHTSFQVVCPITSFSGKVIETKEGREKMLIYLRHLDSICFYLFGKLLFQCRKMCCSEVIPWVWWHCSVFLPCICYKCKWNARTAGLPIIYFLLLPLSFLPSRLHVC